MGDTLIPFSNLRHPRQQQSIQFLVNQFLCSFNLHSSVRRTICHEILSFALQFRAILPSFKIEANIDHVEDLIIGEQGFQETPPPRTRGAPESAIERLIMKQKFDGFNKEEEEEIGDCSVCYEELKGKGKEVSRIPCGHVYHKSCVLTWLQINNSCPLCRAPLES
ncbi:RING finger protein 165-like protein [Cucumis melo var. makuwa]|nr:uncharacterized protein LOC103486202 [Cucumis melo]KAA0041218.1 RING finger protein 165-like protein [Cucumis melo var. makuwa]TYK16021.1 RING finger protein 165-like protein [Cucumis melo var. makuwa]